ncbi:MAG: hypothetical protein LBR34_00670 [Prevotella sp.]|jgi:hypothetical protein|nr:hypothetical protein [Prevotella sp.]
MKKSNALWQWIINPFVKIAGWNAFGVGIVIVGLTVVLGAWGGMCFEGMNVRPLPPELSISLAFAEHAVHIFILILTMYAAGRIFAKHTRFQDILGTVTLSHYPYLLMPLTALFFDYSSFNDPNLLADLLADRHKQITLAISLLPLAFFTFIIVVWHIVLLYNAFKVSTGLKGGKCIAVFIGSLVARWVIVGMLLKMLLLTRL